MSIPQGNGKTVMVTGINGYIASTIGFHLLSNGYNLRGTVRSSKSAAPLLDGAYKDYASRVQIFEVPDITIPGAFDEAVKGKCRLFSDIEELCSQDHQAFMPSTRSRPQLRPLSRVGTIGGRLR